MFEKSSKNIIICPHCGAEYVIDEIYFANYLIGKSKRVLKDHTGKILEVEYKIKPDTTETYNCDYCLRDFGTSISIEAEGHKLSEELDFSVEAVSLE